MIKRLLNNAQPVLRRIYSWYKRKPRNYSYHGTKIKVLPKVFHPGLFYSTEYLLEFSIEKLTSESRKILELGAGAGLISIFLAKKGHNVLASDISSDSVRNLEQNRKFHNLEIEILQSDMFDNIPIQQFDLILINPPYYPKEPKNNEEKAWYCGEDFDYFDKLFSQLSDYIRPNTTILMVLNEDCEIMKIEEIACRFMFSFKQLDSRIIAGETNMIFEIIANN